MNGSGPPGVANGVKEIRVSASRARDEMHRFWSENAGWCAKVGHFRKCGACADSETTKQRRASKSRILLKLTGPYGVLSEAFPQCPRSQRLLLDGDSVVADPAHWTESN